MTATSSAHPAPSARSRAALDAVNVFLADVRDGVGPYLGIYLIATHHWDQGRVGVAMSVVTAATVIAQTPAGALVDRLPYRRELIAAAALAVGAACMAMVLKTTMPVVVAAQAVIGVAAAVVGPAVAAVSLGLVGRRRFDRRVGRNEAFNHAGNVAAAAAAGVLGHFVGREWIFYLVGAFSLVAAASVFLIRPGEIDDALARGADDGDSDAGEGGGSGVWRLLSDRRVAAFAAAVVLFHFANAYMLPLVGQRLASTLGEGSRGATLYMSACIIVAQAVMIPVGLLAGWSAGRFGRRATFLLAFAVLPVRGVLYTLTDVPWQLIAVQALDGVGAGIFGVVSVLMIADLTRGTGRFNLLQGAVGTAVGLGASLSALLTGQLAKARGYDAGFLFLAAVAAVALAVFWLAVGETGPRRVEARPTAT